MSPLQETVLKKSVDLFTQKGRKPKESDWIEGAKPNVE
jgi:hypothetical protein